MPPVDKDATHTDAGEARAREARSVDASQTDMRQASPDLISALAGLDAEHSRHSALRTRRVVTGSAANLRSQRQSSGRIRNLAIAGTVLVLLFITPLIWSSVDSLVGDQHLTDTASELSLLGLLVGSALIAAMLVAGRWRRRG